MQKVGYVLFLLLIIPIAFFATVVGQIFAEESIKSGKKRWTSNQPRSRDISPKKNFLPSLLHPLYAFLEEPVISKICSVSAHSVKEWKIPALIIIISIISICSLGTITVWTNDCLTGSLLFLIQ